jgi:hypothetical protein
MPVTDTGVRDFAAALRTVLYPPTPATLEGWVTRNKMLTERAVFIAGVIGDLAEGRGPVDLRAETGCLRSLAAERLPYEAAEPETPAECDRAMIDAALRKSVLLGETSPPVGAPGHLPQHKGGKPECTLCHLVHDWAATA